MLYNTIKPIKKAFFLRLSLSVIIIFTIHLNLRAQSFNDSSLIIKRPDPVSQSIAGALVYTASFFTLDGYNILKNFDTLSKNSEYQPASTYVVSSLFSALAVAIIGDLTASHNGGSYLSTLTIGWFVSALVAALSNNIYSGKNQSVRFIITLVPSVAVLVLMNQLFFDPNDKYLSYKETSLLGNFRPMIGYKFFGMNFCKQF